MEASKLYEYLAYLELFFWLYLTKFVWPNSALISALATRSISYGHGLQAHVFSFESPWLYGRRIHASMGHCPF